MIKVGPWQDETIEELVTFLQPVDAVQAAILVGSVGSGKTPIDYWSDLDLVIMADDDALDQFHPDTNWLMPLGMLFAYNQSMGEFHRTTRVCFTDMRRLDLIFFPKSTLQNIREWTYNPFRNGYRVLFSKSPLIEESLRQDFQSVAASDASAEQFERMTNDFWFKGTLAVYKVARHDLLIALHLSLDLIRDCLVLGMMLRDRAEGTRHHHTGGIGNELVVQMNAHPLVYTAAGILDSIEQSSKLYDWLAAEWSDVYTEQRTPLLEWIAYARKTLVPSEGSN